MVAAEEGHIEVVQKLLLQYPGNDKYSWSRRADVVKAHDNGRNLFMMAASKGHVDVVKFLFVNKQDWKLR